MFSPTELQSLIESHLEKINIIRKPEELYLPVEYTLKAGGKRIRPVLLLMACNMFSDDLDTAIDPAIGMEMFHNFTLLHDDIMDKSDFRRNIPTVHKKWNENVAILSGDAMMIKSFRFFLGLNDSILREAMDIFTETALNVCEGQQYDMNFESSKNIGIDDYLEMIRLKTAVLLGASMKMGALIGGAGEKNRNLLYDIGEKAGLAFQVQDDLLDTYGNEQEFGKEIGRDIQENKMTFLLVNALQYADTSLRNELLKWLATSRHKEEKRKAVTEIFDKLNIRRLATEKINEYFISALSSLEKVDTREDKKKNIKDFIKKLMSRSR